MASIIGKTIKGQTYYYLREVARVGGKPKVISQRYLGKAADIEAAVEGATAVPDRTRHLAFGDVAATWAMLGRLRVAEVIDEVVGTRRSDAGASVGTYIALATLNRVTDPCSKLAFSDWWAKTAADRWLGLATGALDHRRFWEAMGAISEAHLKEVERRIVTGMVETFGVDLSGLVLDMTNFATNAASPVMPRRGAVVIMGLVVSGVDDGWGLLDAA
jgi:hypothetical protein